MTVQFDHVTKKYRDVTALDDVNVTIEDGDFCFIVGSSGSGKSTFLRLLTRAELPTAGSVKFQGNDLTRMRRHQLPDLRRRIGCVFQDYRLLPNKTIYDNVAFALLVTGHAPREIRKRVPAVLELVGLADKHHAYPEELSGGQQQRASIARAIIGRPHLLIADEPTGNLDPGNAVGIMRLLDRINKTGTTVIMATHDAGIVNNMQRRVIALADGRVVHDAVGGYKRPEAS